MRIPNKNKQCTLVSLFIVVEQIQVDNNFAASFPGRFLKQDDLPPRGGVCRSVCYLHCQRPRRGTNIKSLAPSNRCSSRRECRVWMHLLGWWSKDTPLVVPQWNFCKSDRPSPVFRLGRKIDHLRCHE